VIKISAKLAAALSGSHQAISTVTAVMRSGARIQIPVDTGTATIDSTATNWRTLTMSVSDPHFWPNGSTSVLAPYGTVLEVERGVVYPDGSIEQVKMGSFRITTAEITEQNTEDGGTIAVQVTATDFSDIIGRNLFVDPFVVPSGIRTSKAIQLILVNRFPFHQFPTMPSIDFVNRLPQSEDSIVAEQQSFGTLTGATGKPQPWQDVQKLAASVGAWIYVNADNQWVLEQIPSPTNKAAVWRLSDGNGGALLTVDRTFDDTKTHNGVVLTCHQKKKTPFRVEVWDEESSSPTYYKGPFGKVPLVVTTKLVSTPAQGLAMAKRLFQQNCGFTEQLTATCNPMPHLEVGDVIHIRRARVGVDGVYVIDAIDCPLNIDDTMTLTMRPKQIFL
jgi:uncharacterized protein DUF5047